MGDWNEKLEELHVSNDWDAFLRFLQQRIKGIQTGIPALDKILLGLSGIVVIQGAPGSNKSTLALQIAAHNLAIGNPALFLDRENGKERLRMRLLCQVNRISQMQIQLAKLEQLKPWVKAVNSLPFYAQVKPIKQFEDLDNYLRAMWEKHERPMILVVDSIQKMPLIAEDKRTSISLWMEILDQAKLNWEGKLTILMASEKSRGSGGENYKMASLSAAKESGSLEYTGEQVLDLRENTNGGITCEIVKNRDGIKGVAVELQKVLADAGNPQSFCFRLEGVK